MALVKAEQVLLFYVNVVGHLTLLLLALFFFVPRLQAGRSTAPHSHDPVDVVVKQFLNWLNALIVLWLVFYVGRFFADLPAIQNHIVADWADRLSPYLNVLSAVPLFGIYVVLSKRSIGEPVWGVGPRIWWVIGLIIIVSAMQLGADISDSDKDFDLVAGIANGLVVGGALASMVGRLDSRYFGLSGFVVLVLYLYALIQPLYPYVFASDGTPTIRLAAQYTFVALALIMKGTLIVTVGKVVDIWRLHFYVSNMRWLDAHAATMIAQHDAARAVDGISRSALPLFCFVHPAHRGAILRLEKLDVQVSLTLLNAWLGVGWDIKELRAGSVVISNSPIPVKILRLVEEGTLRVQDNSRHTLARLFIDLAIEQEDLIRRLRQDDRISEALARNQERTEVTLVLKGLRAQLAILEAGSLQYVWTPIEVAHGGDGLTYDCTVNLALVNSRRPLIAG